MQAGVKAQILPQGDKQKAIQQVPLLRMEMQKRSFVLRYCVADVRARRQVDSRTAIAGGNRCCLLGTCFAWESASMPARTRSAAWRPISSIGWRTVVRLGLESAAYGMSSKPMT